MVHVTKYHNGHLLDWLSQLQAISQKLHQKTISNHDQQQEHDIYKTLNLI